MFPVPDDKGLMTVVVKRLAAHQCGKACLTDKLFLTFLRGCASQGIELLIAWLKCLRRSLWVNQVGDGKASLTALGSGKPLTIRQALPHCGAFFMRYLIRTRLGLSVLVLCFAPALNAQDFL